MFSGARVSATLISDCSWFIASPMMVFLLYYLHNIYKNSKRTITVRISAEEKSILSDLEGKRKFLWDISSCLSICLFVRKVLLLSNGVISP